MTSAKEPKENNPLNNEDRLKGIAYQFLKLYERWAEDRQVLNKNMAAFEELLQIFISDLKGFRELEGQVRDQIHTSIENGAKHVSHEIGKLVGDSITFEVDLASVELKRGVNEANQILKRYQEREQKSLLVTMGITIGTAIITSLLIVWLLIPKPTLPLTDNQIADYQNGQLFSKIWPKLSKKEQNHLKELANKPMASQNNNATND